MEDLLIGLGILLLLIIIFLAPNIKMVKEGEAIVIERFGAFSRVIDKPGVYMLIPLIERAIQNVPLTNIDRHFSVTLTKDLLIETHKIHYTYQVIDVMLFVYAALDSVKAFETYIQNQTNETLKFDHISVEVLEETAEVFGMKLHQINLL